MGFAKQEHFLDVFHENTLDMVEEGRMWRFHTICWAAANAVELSGDFVECGVFNGLSMNIVLDYLNWKDDLYPKTSFHLFDTFTGLTEEQSTEEERKMFDGVYKKFPKMHDFVVERFKDYKRVYIHEGELPGMLDLVELDSIAFLHMDLNTAIAERATMEILWDRVVIGGHIILDDFGHIIQQNLHDEHASFFEEKDHEVLELPTGQGLVIKMKEGKDA